MRVVENNRLSGQDVRFCGRDDRTRTRVLAEYLPTLLFLIVATGIGIALIVIGNVLGPKRPTAEKLSPYECGFAAFEDARMRFDVRYYLVAILFIVFDLEIAFVFPWAVVFRELGVFGLVEMGVFLTLLVIGFIYVWKKGALEWE
jgi:NADH-quinone oxidoreductase subunit A